MTSYGTNFRKIERWIFTFAWTIYLPGTKMYTFLVVLLVFIVDQFNEHNNTDLQKAFCSDARRQTTLMLIQFTETVNDRWAHFHLRLLRSQSTTGFIRDGIICRRPTDIVLALFYSHHWFRRPLCLRPPGASKGLTVNTIRLLCVSGLPVGSFHYTCHINMYALRHIIPFGPSIVCAMIIEVSILSYIYCFRRTINRLVEHGSRIFSMRCYIRKNKYIII